MTEHTLRQSTSWVSFSLAGFQVIPYGRFWVIPEVLLILAGAGLVFQLRTVQQPEVGDWGIPQTRTRHVLQLETSLHNEGKHFFVFTDATLFLAMNYYSKHPEEYVFSR